MHSIEPSFAELGDLSRYAPLNVNLEFVSALQNHLSQKEYVLLHENTLDDVTSFGAHLLTKDFKTKPRIVALSSTHQSQELISYYAEKIEELVQETSQRIAVIGIGNGSAACTKESLFGQKEAGVEFEKKLSRNIASLDDESLQKLFEMSAGAYQDIMIPLAYLYYITKSHEPDFLSQSPVHAMGVMTHTIHINLRS
ncbi:hypothetical protein IT409_00150 [Candidatus Falkowbacteria bacterium]|nr:hypothetical protein [Candidatus Falkowbacteria bacterium]